MLLRKCHWVDKASRDLGQIRSVLILALASLLCNTLVERCLGAMFRAALLVVELVQHI